MRSRLLCILVIALVHAISAKAQVSSELPKTFDLAAIDTYIAAQVKKRASLDCPLPSCAMVKSCLPRDTAVAR